MVLVYVDGSNSVESNGPVAAQGTDKMADLQIRTENSSITDEQKVAIAAAVAAQSTNGD